ncbi:hypothetical protein FRC11_001020, partial [Ceratobasidium sp. 423]
MTAPIKPPPSKRTKFQHLQSEAFQLPYQPSLTSLQRIHILDSYTIEEENYLAHQRRLINLTAYHQGNVLYSRLANANALMAQVSSREPEAGEAPPHAFLNDLLDPLLASEQQVRHWEENAPGGSYDETTLP